MAPTIASCALNESLMTVRHVSGFLRLQHRNTPSRCRVTWRVAEDTRRTASVELRQAPVRRKSLHDTDLPSAKPAGTRVDAISVSRSTRATQED